MCVHKLLGVLSFFFHKHVETAIEISRPFRRGALKRVNFGALGSPYFRPENGQMSINVGTISLKENKEFVVQASNLSGGHVSLQGEYLP